MPMYYPTFESIKELAVRIHVIDDETKRYNGIIPTEKDEEQLARVPLVNYIKIFFIFRVWKT